MPVPVKSLQSMPLAASYIFGQLKISRPGSKFGKKKGSDEYTQKIAKSIAEDTPGYSRKCTINNTDATEELRIIQQDISGNTGDFKSVDLCKRIGNKVANETDDNIVASGTTKIRSKVTLYSITLYNQKLATRKESKKSALRSSV